MYTMYTIAWFSMELLVLCVHKCIKQFIATLPVRLDEEFAKYLSFDMWLTPKSIVRVLISFVFGALDSYYGRREKSYIKTGKCGELFL